MWPFILLGAAQAGASLFQGISQSKANKAQAENLQEQSIIKREEGILAKRSIFDQAIRQEKQGQAFLGGQRAAFASSGVKSTTGSPLAVLRESQRAIQQDVSRTRSLGERALTLGLNQASLLTEEAQISKEFGREQLASGVIGAGTSFLGTLVQKNIYENFWEV